MIPSTVGELETVIAIPPLPFRGGVLDTEAYRKNLRYLMEKNFLHDGRRRAIAIAGTSLIHHLDAETLFDLVRITGETIRHDAILIAGLVATPPSAARAFVNRCMKLGRPPDFFLLMPIPGVCNPDGIREEFHALARDSGEQLGARFLLYMRSSDLVAAYASLISASPHVVGVKIGTAEPDVANMRAALPVSKTVLWGVGDRATEAARQGARGHTSGITLICPRVCDEIHNAYRQADFATATRLEQLLAEFEEIRFMEARAYNYSAVVAAAQVGGFLDIDLGEGAPFNAPPPSHIMARIAGCVDRLRCYH